MNIKCVRFKSVQKASLQGFADILIEDIDMEIYGLTLHMKDGKSWINFPSKEYKDDQGNTKYAAYFRFSDKSKYEDFQKKVKNAIEKHCSESQQISPVQEKSVHSTFANKNVQPEVDDLPF